MTTRREWAKALLSGGGFPESERNISLVVAWQIVENSGWAYNPLGVGAPQPWANFKSGREGIQKTLNTLLNYPGENGVRGGRYAAARRMMIEEKQETPAEDILKALYVPPAGSTASKTGAGWWGNPGQAGKTFESEVKRAGTPQGKDAPAIPGVLLKVGDLPDNPYASPPAPGSLLDLWNRFEEAKGQVQEIDNDPPGVGTWGEDWASKRDRFTRIYDALKREYVSGSDAEDARDEAGKATDTPNARTFTPDEAHELNRILEDVAGEYHDLTVVRPALRGVIEMLQPNPPKSTQQPISQPEKPATDTRRLAVNVADIVRLNPPTIAAVKGKVGDAGKFVAPPVPQSRKPIVELRPIDTGEQKSADRPVIDPGPGRPGKVRTGLSTETGRSKAPVESGPDRPAGRGLLYEMARAAASAAREARQRETQERVETAETVADLKAYEAEQKKEAENKDPRDTGTPTQGDQPKPDESKKAAGSRGDEPGALEDIGGGAPDPQGLRVRRWPVRPDHPDPDERFGAVPDEDVGARLRKRLYAPRPLGEEMARLDLLWRDPDPLPQATPREALITAYLAYEAGNGVIATPSGLPNPKDEGGTGSLDRRFARVPLRQDAGDKGAGADADRPYEEGPSDVWDPRRSGAMVERGFGSALGMLRTGRLM